jgi:hypothetical protein
LYCIILKVKTILIQDRFLGADVAQLVKVLRYKPEGRGFDSRLSNLNFY